MGILSTLNILAMGILSTMPFFNHGDFECLPPLMTYMYTVQRKTETMINVLVI
mgnify:CR=1 FL=1